MGRDPVAAGAWELPCVRIHDELTERCQGPEEGPLELLRPPPPPLVPSSASGTIRLGRWATPACR